ncbi:MAG: hypothetical protein WC119_02075 [Synergistaceae bacterium]
MTNPLEKSYSPDIGHAAFSPVGYQKLRGSPSKPFYYVSGINDLAFSNRWRYSDVWSNGNFYYTTSKKLIKSSYSGDILFSKSFSSPTSVSAIQYAVPMANDINYIFSIDRGCWMTDSGSKKLFRLDSNLNTIDEITSLSKPTVVIACPDTGCYVFDDNLKIIIKVSGSASVENYVPYSSLNIIHSEDVESADVDIENNLWILENDVIRKLKYLNGSLTSGLNISLLDEISAISGGRVLDINIEKSATRNYVYAVGCYGGGGWIAKIKLDGSIFASNTSLSSKCASVVRVSQWSNSNGVYLTSEEERQYIPVECQSSSSSSSEAIIIGDCVANFIFEDIPEVGADWTDASIGIINLNGSVIFLEEFPDGGGNVGAVMKTTENNQSFYVVFDKGSAYYEHIYSLKTHSGTIYETTKYPSSFGHNFNFAPAQNMCNTGSLGEITYVTVPEPAGTEIFFETRSYNPDTGALLSTYRSNELAGAIIPFKLVYKGSNCCLEAIVDGEGYEISSSSSSSSFDSSSSGDLSESSSMDSSSSSSFGNSSNSSGGESSSSTTSFGESSSSSVGESSSSSMFIAAEYYGDNFTEDTVCNGYYRRTETDVWGNGIFENDYGVIMRYNIAFGLPYYKIYKPDWSGGLTDLYVNLVPDSSWPPAGNYSEYSGTGTGNIYRI